MDIEIVESVRGDYRLFDGDRFLADCGSGQEGEQRAKEIKALEVSNGRLRVERNEAQRLISEMHTTFADMMRAKDAAQADAAALRAERDELRSTIVWMREGGHELPASLFRESLEWDEK